MRTIYCLLLLTITFSSYSQNLTSGGKLKPEQAIMDVRHYTINLSVDIPLKSINGFAIIDVITSQPASTLLFDLMNDLTVQSVSLNGKSAPFTHANNLITITSPVAAGKNSVKIIYGGKPHIATRPPWEDGFTWTTDSTGHPWIAITAEGGGGKIYFPCKDHPLSLIHI